jgi:cytochrome c-type biogenesis protein CcmH
MIRFLFVALLLSLAAAAFLVLPLLRARSASARAPLAASAAVLVLLVAGLGLYAWAGDRYWSAPPEAQSNETISTLAREVEKHPDDLQSWLQLGDAYNGLGNYALALRCFQSANRLSGGRDAAALTGMAESMIMQDDGNAQNDKAAELLERALKLDPHYPRALFYSAVVAYRDGHLELARQRFEIMMSLSPPDNVRGALQHQIDEIDARLKGGPAADGPGQVASTARAAAPGNVGGAGADAATAIHLHVTVSAALADKVPADAALFVFVRSPDGGPPLAVKRSGGRLPQNVDLSAADAMVAGRAVQPGQAVSVVARISASGSALPQSGDLYGEIHYVAGQSGSQGLEIDQRTP